MPFGVSGNMILRRTDLLGPAGFTEAPATWDELVEQAEAVNAPPVSGLGFALSNVGDGNLQVAVMQSFGGRIADDAGKTVDDQVRRHPRLSRMGQGRVGPGRLPAGQRDLGRRGRQPGLPVRAGGVHRQHRLGRHRGQGPGPRALRGDRAISPLPAGPEGVVSPLNLQLRAIPKTAQNPDAAQALIEHLAQPEFMQEYFKVAIYGPVLMDQAASRRSTDRARSMRACSSWSRTARRRATRTSTTPPSPTSYNNFIVPKMVQRVVIDGWDVDRAMDEAQTQAQSIYDKYK